MRTPFRRRLVSLSAAAAVLAACTDRGAGIGSDFAAKATACSPGDHPETALQGQVPAALRASGFTGFNCNLSLIGQLPGEGGNWSAATFKSGQRTCAYYATELPTPARKVPGVPVIEIDAAGHPMYKTSLTTPAMMDPWESLRVHTPRKLLIGDNGRGPEVDLYDLSVDCASPQLLASIPVGTGTDGGIALANSPLGHEGNLSPDGLTYYIGDPSRGAYHAVDITNASKPKLIASVRLADIGTKSQITHGLSVSADGNRMYGAIVRFPNFGMAEAPDAENGFVVFDTSEVQRRLPNAKIRLISKVDFPDGTIAQHTIPITVAGKPYLVHVDEGGSEGVGNATNVRTACAAGLSPFPMARIFDMADERHPKLVSKLQLQTHDPANCEQVLPDIVGLDRFTYGSHYCSVDNRDNATALACSYFNSGVRVFDIRQPTRPKEIAYFNPPAAPARPGSTHVVFNQWRPGGPDWCASRLDFDFANRRLTTMCQDNGLLVLRFAPGTWPFGSSTPSSSQN